MENGSNMPVVTEQMIEAARLAWNNLPENVPARDAFTAIYLAMHIHRPLSEGPR